MDRRTTTAAALSAVIVLWPTSPAAATPQEERVVAPASPRHWDPLNDELWDFTDGRIGFGSFDNLGRTRHFRAIGTAAP